jgi:hypothetical protein
MMANSNSKIGWAASSSDIYFCRDRHGERILSALGGNTRASFQRQNVVYHSYTGVLGIYVGLLDLGATVHMDVTPV